MKSVIGCPMYNSGTLTNTGITIISGNDGTSGSYIRPIAVYSVNRANVTYGSSLVVTLRAYCSDSSWDWTIASSKNEKVDLGECGDLINCFSKKTVRKFYFKSDK